jgi:hypothetical protein
VPDVLLVGELLGVVEREQILRHEPTPPLRSLT